MNIEEKCDRIKESVSVSDVMSDNGYHPERANSTSTMYRCPFHDDRTPSFSVFADDKGYKCHGCGEKGSVIDLAMKFANVTNVGEILGYFANRFNMPDLVEPEEKSPWERIVKPKRREPYRYDNETLRALCMIRRRVESSDNPDETWKAWAPIIQALMAIADRRDINQHKRAVRSIERRLQGGKR